MTIDATQIIVSAIGLLSLILSGFLIPWLRSKTYGQKQEMLNILCKTAVYAAQQILVNNKEKKEYAIAYVQDVLYDYGFSVDEGIISDTIEAALLQIKTELGKSWT